MVVKRGRKAGVLAACAGVVLATLTAAGCSGKGAVAADVSAAEARAAVREAAGVLARSGTSRARTAVEMNSGGTRVTIRGSGVFDYGRRTGRLEVVLPGEATEDGERRPIVELITPDALYMRNRGAGVPDGKWVRVDTAGLPDGNLVTGGATDPISAAELLRGARSVSFRGEERLHGEKVRHYRGTTDIVVAAGAADPRSRRHLAAAAEGLSHRTVPFDAYVDARGRLRKVRHRFTFPATAGTSGRGRGGEVSVVSTTTLYGFGVPVEVGLPEPGDIYTGRVAAP
ncbi:lipoprotein [Streptomyces glaucosporus]|uniref:Lipoprotein n=1 Tax=Streptomyces glaucosporus TaxID=284044 RepID=A0ABN3HTG3_9ACTN